MNSFNSDGIAAGVLGALTLFIIVTWLITSPLTFIGAIVLACIIKMRY